MKKIVSIISIFAIMMSLCVTSFANDLAEDEEIREISFTKRVQIIFLRMWVHQIFVKYLKIQICLV